MGKANLILQNILDNLKIKWVTEYRFFKGRKWRADYFLPDYDTIIEIEGGVWIKGRHVRPSGYENDCEKYNKAQLMGYKVIRFTTDMIEKKPAYVIDILKSIKEGDKCED